MDKMTVYAPGGAYRAKDAGTATRTFATMSEAVVAEVWDYRFRGNEIYAALRKVLAPRYPGISFVDSDVFGDVHGNNSTEIVEALPGHLREHHCNAVLVGVGA